MTPDYLLATTSTDNGISALIFLSALAVRPEGEVRRMALGGNGFLNPVAARRGGQDLSGGVRAVSDLHKPA